MNGSRIGFPNVVNQDETPGLRPADGR